MKGRYQQTIENRNFRLLFYSRAVSRFGDGIHEIALILLVYTITGSATMMATVAISSMLPNLIFSLFGGVFADRFDRKRIMILCDIGRSLSVFLIPLLYWTGVLEVWIICIIAFVTSVFESFFTPCEFACVPDLVGLPNVQSANALFNIVGQLISVIGLGVGGTIVGFIGPDVALCVDSASFLCSAFFVAFLPRLLPPERKERINFSRELLDGLKFVRGNGLILSTLLLCAVVNFAFAPIPILLPIYNAEILRQHSAVYGYLMASHALGMAIGFLWGGNKAQRGKDILLSGAPMIIALGLLIPAAWLPCPINLILSLVALFTEGLFSGKCNVLIFTVLQKTPPTNYRGRVGSVVNILTLILQPLSLGIFGPLIEILGVLLVLAISVVLIGSIIPYSIRTELYKYDEGKG